MFTVFSSLRGTNILLHRPQKYFHFWLVLKFEKKDEPWQGWGVWVEREVSKGQRKGFLNWLLAPLRRRKQRTSITEMTKKTPSLGWVILSVQPGSEWGGEGHRLKGAGWSWLWDWVLTEVGWVQGKGVGRRAGNDEPFMWRQNVRRNRGSHPQV